MPQETRKVSYAAKTNAASSANTRGASNAANNEASADQTQGNSQRVYLFPPSPSPPRPEDKTMDTGNREKFGDVSKEFEKLTALILEKSKEHDVKLEAISVTTKATDSKLADIANRISEVERRVVSLEEAVDDIRAAEPGTSSAELEALRLKLDEIENRERRLNLRLVGFPPHCEQGDVIKFLCDTLPTLLNIQFPHGLEFQRAHRTGPLRDGETGGADGGSGQPAAGRTIIARFLRFQDRTLVADAARKMGNVVWNDHRIMVFADYSKLVMEKRFKFKECKKSLHDLDVRFSLEFPAVLVIRTPQGKRRFEDAAKAMDFIRSMG